jgi:hypothetical protein
MQDNMRQINARLDQHHEVAATDRDYDDYDDPDDDGDDGGGSGGGGDGSGRKRYTGIDYVFHMCGLADNASRFLQLFGLTDAKALSMLTKKRIHDTITQIYRRNLKDKVRPVYAIPAVNNLNALCLWVSYHVVQGSTAYFDSITEDILNHHLTGYHIIEGEKHKAKVDEKKKAPGNFETFNAAKFITWEESFNQYLHLHRSNTSKTSLEYLICPKLDVSPEMLIKDYESIDDDLNATHKMEGPKYQQDNQWLELTFV